MYTVLHSLVQYIKLILPLLSQFTFQTNQKHLDESKTSLYKNMNPSNLVVVSKL